VAELQREELLRAVAAAFIQTLVWYGYAAVWTASLQTKSTVIVSVQFLFSVVECFI
jgi:hypothetical protein